MRIGPELSRSSQNRSVMSDPTLSLIRIREQVERFGTVFQKRRKAQTLVELADTDGPVGRREARGSKLEQPKTASVQVAAPKFTQSEKV